MSVVVEENSDLAVSKHEATNRLAAELKDSGALADLFARIDAGDIDLTGDGGLIPALVKTTLERGLAAEMDSHLGYSHSDREGKAAKGRKNSRNGSYSKTVDSQGRPHRDPGDCTVNGANPSGAFTPLTVQSPVDDKSRLSCIVTGAVIVIAVR